MTKSARPTARPLSAVWCAITLAAHLSIPAAALAAQAVVGSDVPSGVRLTLSDEPLVRIGVLDGPAKYMSGEVTGALRLEDGSVVVADEQSYEVRLFDPAGRHVWTSGREGEGPGEYGGLRLLKGCPGAPITVFDWNLDHITELDAEGGVTRTLALAAAGVNPYGEPKCAPDGSLVFTPWPARRPPDPGLEVGETFRWTMSLDRMKGDSVTTLQSGLPGTERCWYGERRDFAREQWRDIRAGLPDRFPAFETRGLMALAALADVVEGNGDA